jgi:hypothetical protein
MLTKRRIDREFAMVACNNPGMAVEVPDQPFHNATKEPNSTGGRICSQRSCPDHPHGCLGRPWSSIGSARRLLCLLLAPMPLLRLGAVGREGCHTGPSGTSSGGPVEPVSRTRYHTPKATEKHTKPLARRAYEELAETYAAWGGWFGEKV